jgi:glucokinase
MTGGQVIAGIDLGGTGTRIALIGTDGTVVGHRTIATASMGGTGVPDLAVRALAGHILDVAGPGRRIIAAGVGASGPVGADGIIRNDDTLPSFSHFPVLEVLSAVLEAPCAIENDAVTAAVGEYTRGAGRGTDCLLMATLGTGIGVCVLNLGRPHRGGDGLHPEAGHLPVPGPPAPCYCGLPACWEQNASRTVLGRRSQALAGLETESPRASIELAALRARNGERSARELFHRYGNDVGQGLGALATVFRPSRVVIGGSVASHLDLFLPGIQQALSRRPPFDAPAELRAAELGDLAGAIGAAEMARELSP